MIREVVERNIVSWVQIPRKITQNKSIFAILNFYSKIEKLILILVSKFKMTFLSNYLFDIHKITNYKISG